MSFGPAMNETTEESAERRRTASVRAMRDDTLAESFLDSCIDLHWGKVLRTGDPLVDWARVEFAELQRRWQLGDVIEAFEIGEHDGRVPAAPARQD